MGDPGKLLMLEVRREREGERERLITVRCVCCMLCAVCCVCCVCCVLSLTQPSLSLSQVVLKEYESGGLVEKAGVTGALLQEGMHSLATQYVYPA